MIDRPLFRDLQSALRWAWYGSIDASNTVKGPSYASLQKDDEREQIDGEKPAPFNTEFGGVPRGLLAAGQAGAIKRHVMAMPGDEGAHVLMKFLAGREQREGRRILRRLVADYVGASGVDRRAVGLLVAWHYGAKGLSASSIAEKVEIDRRRVAKLNNRVRITLDALGCRAEERLYQTLRDRGVVL